MLLPLLLAEGLNVVAEEFEPELKEQIEAYVGLGLLTEKDLHDKRKMQSLRKAMVLNREEVKVSRALFEKLQKAWRKLDEEIRKHRSGPK